jgi:hypothetical protein
MIRQSFLGVCLGCIYMSRTKKERNEIRGRKARKTFGAVLVRHFVLHAFSWPVLVFVF